MLLSVGLAVGCGGSSASRPIAASKPAAAAPAQPEKPAQRAAEETDGERREAPESDGPAWLGVELATRDSGEAGVLVRGVLRGSPAESAGVLAGDVIVSVDGENVLSPGDVQHAIRSRPSSARVSLGLLRGGAPRILAVQLERMPTEDEVMRKSFVGAAAPDFGQLKTVQGSITPELPALRGRVVVIEFWATWCNVCRFMIPVLNDWHDRYGAQGVTVLGVTTEPVTLASQGAFEYGMSYAVASDESGDMTRAYRALALPTLFVIDRQGKVRDVMVGYSTERLTQMESLVQRLVSES